MSGTNVSELCAAELGPKFVFCFQPSAGIRETVHRALAAPGVQMMEAIIGRQSFSVATKSSRLQKERKIIQFLL